MVLLCLFCCNIYFGVHQYQLVPIYLPVSSYSPVTVGGCSKSRKLKLFCDQKFNWKYCFQLHVSLHDLG